MRYRCGIGWAFRFVLENEFELLILPPLDREPVRVLHPSGRGNRRHDEDPAVAQTVKWMDPQQDVHDARHSRHCVAVRVGRPKPEPEDVLPIRALAIDQLPEVLSVGIRSRLEYAALSFEKRYVANGERAIVNVGFVV
jgi:hypothetical protein